MHRAAEQRVHGLCTERPWPQRRASQPCATPQWACRGHVPLNAGASSIMRANILASEGSYPTWTDAAGGQPASVTRSAQHSVTKSVQQAARSASMMY